MSKYLYVCILTEHMPIINYFSVMITIRKYMEFHFLLLNMQGGNLVVVQSQKYGVNAMVDSMGTACMVEEDDHACGL